MLANPPFNVDEVDKDEARSDDPRYPFGLPRPDNANYLWIQLFYSALNDKGRAGFVMANSACDARTSEQDIRRQLIEARAVDVMVAVGPNLFYTVTLPCTLWFFDKGKRDHPRADTVLFIDARHIFRRSTAPTANGRPRRSASLPTSSASIATSQRRTRTRAPRCWPSASPMASIATWRDSARWRRSRRSRRRAGA